jgi:hypothetical protein
MLWLLVRQSRTRVLVLAVGVALSGACAAGQDTPADPAQQKRLEKLRADGVKVALTILPAIVMEKPMPQVADVLGLLLEKDGLENLETAQSAFTPPEGTTWEQLPAALGEFVRQNPPATGYVLFSEFVGTPQTGPKEVRFVIVDKAGALVLADRQTPADSDFKKTVAEDPDPMGCSVLVSQRIHKLLKLPPAPEPEREGKFAKLWAQKSGTPTDEERAAMKKAQEQLKTALRSSKLLVLPTRVNGEVNAEQAQALATAVSKKFGCQARVADTPFKVEIAPNANEQKVLWDLARALRAHLRQNRPEADYVLLADYALRPGGPVGFVHFFVCNQAGEWVIVDFQNSVWDDFKQIDPKSAEDCDRLVVRRLAGYLQ